MKKMLVAFDQLEGPSSGNAWVVPASRSAGPEFICLSDGHKAELGMVVYVGRSIENSDLATKIRHAGIEPCSPNVIDEFLSAVNALKVGDVVSLSFDGSAPSIVPTKKKAPSVGFRPKLP